MISACFVTCMSTTLLEDEMLLPRYMNWFTNLLVRLEMAPYLKRLLQAMQKQFGLGRCIHEKR